MDTSEGKRKMTGAAALVVALLISVTYVWLHSGTLELPQFWSHEGSAVMNVSGKSVVKTASLTLSQAPESLLYNTVASSSVKRYGFNRTSLRMPALVFGGLCLLLVFMIASRLLGAGAGLAAIIAMFLSPPLLLMSMTADGKTMFLSASLGVVLVSIDYMKRNAVLRTVVLALLCAVVFAADMFAGTCAALCGLWFAHMTSAAPGEKKSFSFMRMWLLPVLIGLVLTAVLKQFATGDSGMTAVPRESVGVVARALILFIGASGGPAAGNVAIAALLFLLAAIGAVKLLKKDRSVFTLLAVPLTALLCAETVYSYVYGLQNTAASFAVSLMMMFVYVPAAYASQSFIATVSSTEAAGMFSAKALVRMLFGGVFLLLFSAMFFGYSVYSIAKVHQTDRQNWGDAIKSLSNSASPDSRVFVRKREKAIIDFYLSMSKSKPTIIALDDAQFVRVDEYLARMPQSWVMATESMNPFGRNAKAGQGKMLVRYYSTRFAGFLGDVLTMFVGGYFASDELVFSVGRTPAENGKEKRMPFECASPDNCEARIYLPQDGEYEVAVSVATPSDGTARILACGEQMDVPLERIGAKTRVKFTRKQGTCSITAMFGKSSQTGIYVDVKRKQPYTGGLEF